MTLTEILTRIEAIVESKLDAKHGKPLHVVDSPFWIGEATRPWHGFVYITSDDPASPGVHFGQPGYEEERLTLEVHLGWVANQKASKEEPLWRLTRRRITTAIETDTGYPALKRLIQYTGGRVERGVLGNPQYLDIIMNFDVQYFEAYPETE